MSHIETINVQRVAITIGEVKKLNIFQALNEDNLYDDAADDTYIFLEAEFAHYYGLISEIERNKMIDYNSRVTLQGVKAYKWRELSNTESEDGSWDITFKQTRNPNGSAEYQRNRSLIIGVIEKTIQKGQIEGLESLQQQLKTLEDQFSLNQVRIALYDDLNSINEVYVTEYQFEQLIDLLKRIG